MAVLLFAALKKIKTVALPTLFPLLLAPLVCAARIAPPLSVTTAPAVAVHYVYRPVAADSEYGLVCRTGELCEKTTANGGAEYYDYRYDERDNPDGLMDEAVLTDAAGRVTASLAYRYGFDGQTTSESFAAADGTDYRLSDVYDAQDRLIGQTRTDLRDPAASTTARFAYSGDDDMLIENTERAHGAAQDKSYRYNGTNRRLETCAEHGGGRHCRVLAYDGRGNLLAGDGHGNAYAYNDLRRTVAARDAAGLTVGYAYYPDGRRADKTAHGERLSYHYSEDAPLDAEHGEQSAHWLLADGREAKVTETEGNAQTRYPFVGILGGVLAESGDSGALAGTHEYAAFGRRLDAHQQKTRKPHDPLDLTRSQFGFQGEPQDAETGNTYHETRYNTGSAMWTTHDELETLNPYATFDQDPVNETDEDGRLPAGDALSWAQTALDVASYLPGAAGTAASLGAYALSAARMPDGNDGDNVSPVMSDDGEGGLEDGGDDGSNNGGAMPWWGWGLIGIGVVATIGAAIYGVRRCRRAPDGPNTPLLKADNPSKAPLELVNLEVQDKNAAQSLAGKHLDDVKGILNEKDVNIVRHDGGCALLREKNNEEVLEEIKKHIQWKHDEEYYTTPDISKTLQGFGAKLMPESVSFPFSDRVQEQMDLAKKYSDATDGGKLVAHNEMDLRENDTSQCMTGATVLFLIKAAKELKSANKAVPSDPQKLYAAYKSYKKIQAVA